MRDLEDANNRNTKISFNLFNFLCWCSVRLNMKLNIDVLREALTTFEYREHPIISLPAFSHAQKHSVLQHYRPQSPHGFQNRRLWERG